jgi:Zn-dependent protease
MNYLIYGIIFYALLVGFRYFLIFQRLLGLTLQYPDYKLKGEDEFPDYLKNLFQAPAQELEPLGFQFCTYLELEEIDVGNKRWGILLYHPDFLTFARVTTSALPAPGNLVNLDFNTFFEDGVLLLTLNGLAHGIIEEIPATIVQDPYAIALEEQWRSHQAKLEQLLPEKTPKSLSPETFIELSESHEAAYLNSLLVSQQIVRQPERELFDLTVGTALKTAIKVGRGSVKQGELLKKRAARATHGKRDRIDIPPEVEVEAFHYLDLWEKRRARKGAKLGILLVSLVLFVAAAKVLFDLKTIAILLLVLLFHELGHFFAMRLFGYQDTSIFFLPLFGAAASGRKENATPSEQAIVLLAGPVPGLLLGAGLAIVLQNKLLQFPGAWDVVIWLVALNSLNLLPLLPLDGGRVVNLLLFSRNPYTDVLFKIFTVSLLAIAGLGLGDPILIPLALLIAFSIPNSFRSAKILRQLQQQSFPTNEPDSLLLSIFRALQTSGYKSVQFAQKYRLVKEIAQRYREPRASWLTRLSLLALYLLCLFGGLLLIGATFWLNANPQR